MKWLRNHRKLLLLTSSLSATLVFLQWHIVETHGLSQRKPHNKQTFFIENWCLTSAVPPLNDCNRAVQRKTKHWVFRHEPWSSWLFLPHFGGIFKLLHPPLYNAPHPASSTDCLRHPNMCNKEFTRFLSLWNLTTALSWEQICPAMVHEK